MKEGFRGVVRAVKNNVRTAKPPSTYICWNATFA